MSRHCRYNQWIIWIAVLLHSYHIQMQACHTSTVGRGCVLVWSWITNTILDFPSLSKSYMILSSQMHLQNDRKQLDVWIKQCYSNVKGFAEVCTTIYPYYRPYPKDYLGIASFASG